MADSTLHERQSWRQTMGVAALEKFLWSIWDSFAALLILFVPAGLARLLWHWNMVQAGKRRFWSAHMFFEFCTAVFSMIVALGIAKWAGVGQEETWAVIGFAAWLGPKGLEALLLLAIKTVRTKST